MLIQIFSHHLILFKNCFIIITQFILGRLRLWYWLLYWFRLRGLRQRIKFTFFHFLLTLFLELFKSPLCLSLSICFCPSLLICFDFGVSRGLCLSFCFCLCLCQCLRLSPSLFLRLGFCLFFGLFCIEISSTSHLMHSEFRFFNVLLADFTKLRLFLSHFVL